jgi:hypothetical protein
MKEEVKTRIRATGEGAERVRAYLTEKIPEAEIVGADHPAEFVMTTCEFRRGSRGCSGDGSYARTRGEERLPIEPIDPLLSGESPVRVWREHCRMRLVAFADQAGIGKGYLSQIETGERTRTINTMKKLARALDIELDDLV